MTTEPEQDEPKGKKSPFDYKYEDLTGPDGWRKRRQIKLIGAGINAVALGAVFAVAAIMGAFDSDEQQLPYQQAAYSAPFELPATTLQLKA